MTQWFAKYGFPIEAIYTVNPDGGAVASGHAAVQLVKTSKNIWKKRNKYRKEKEAEDSMVAYAKERMEMMY